MIFSDVRKISTNNTFLSVYCHISSYNGSLSTLECLRTLKTFWFTNTRRQDYVHRSLYFWNNARQECGILNCSKWTHRRPCRTELKNLVALQLSLYLYHHIHVVLHCPKESFGMFTNWQIFRRVRKIMKSFAKFFCLSFRPPAWTNSAPIERIFIIRAGILYFSKFCRKNSSVINP